MDDKKYALKESYEAIIDIQNKTKYPKVLIGIVTSVHKMYCLPQFMKHLRNINYPNYEVLIVDNSPEDQATNFCRSMREVGYTVIHHERIKHTRDNLVKSRNMLVDYFVKHNEDNPNEQFEHFFSLESDVCPAPDVIQELMKNQVNCVSGVYMNGKVYPADETRKHEMHTWIPMAWQYPEDGIEELNVLRPMEILKDIVPSELQRVQSTGLGLLLISKMVVEKLQKLGGFKVELDSVACDDMYFFMDVTKMCDKCDYISDKYIRVCPKCGSHCVWSHLDSKVWAKHLHSEWGPELRKNR